MDLVKAILWLARKILLIVPSLLIAVLGFSYLRLCYLELLAPNKPVEFRYMAAGGEVRVRADSYLIDLDHGRVTVSGFGIDTPSQGVVAAAKRVVISELVPRRGAAQSPSIDIYQLTGSLVRLPNGKFPLEGMLPSSASTTKSSFPYRVRVHHADVLLIDLKGSVWKQRVTTELVTVAGAGSDWVAFATGDLPGMGSGTTTIQYASGLGLRVAGSTPQLRCEKLLSHLMADKTLRILDKARDLRVGQASVSGEFKVFVPKNLKFGFESNLTATVRGLAWKQYKADQVQFAGKVSQEGIAGTVKATSGGNQVSGLGSAKFVPTLEASAKVALTSPNPSALPAVMAKLFPKGVAYRGGKFDGWVSYGQNHPVTGQGLVSADQVTYRNEIATKPQALIFATEKSIRADIQRVAVAGASPSGSVQIDLTHKTLIGYIHGKGLDLEHIANLTHTKGLSGTGSVEAIVTGPLAKPLVAFAADGEARYRREKIRLGPDEVHVTGSFQNNIVQIRRGLLKGPDGLLTVSGSGTPGGAKLDMDVEARDISLAQFLPDASGLVAVSGRVVGDARNPRATGTVRAVDIAYRDQRIPVATADFTADLKQITATEIGAISGTMDLEGSASLALKTSALSGQFSLNGVELAQFLGEQGAGIVDVPTIQLNGTLAKPSIVARLEGTNLIGGDVLIDSVEALVTANRAGATVDHATANFAGGSISANGSYEFASKSGSGVATSTAFDLSKLAPALGQTLTLTGAASITEGKFAYRDGLISGSASGKLDHIVANEAPVGDGNWTISSDGDAFNGTLSLGQLEPVLRVVDLDATYHLKDKTINGSFDADRAHLSDILSASLRYLPESWSANSAALFGLSGDLTVGATFEGPVQAPNLKLDTLNLAEFKVKGAAFGTVTASKITRDHRVWTIPNFSFSGPQGEITGSGTVAEDGNIDAKVSGKEIKAAAFSSLVPSLANSKAVGSFGVSASGESKNPDLTANLVLEHIVAAPQTDTGKAGADLSIKIPKAELVKGNLSLKGTFDFDGFSGSFDGAAPISYQKGLGDGSLLAHVTLDRRELKDLPFVTPFIDTSRSQGFLSGDLTAKGPLGDLGFSGGVNFTASSLAFKVPDPNSFIKRIDDQFKSVQANLSVSGGKLAVLDLEGSSVRGGAISLNANVPLPDFGRMFASDLSNSQASILNSRLQGELNLKGLQVRQSLPGGFVAATVTGKTPLGGTLRNPEIGTQATQGTFALSDVDTTLPNLVKGAGSSSTPAINPSFNLHATLANPAHVKSSTAEVNLNGAATLRGSLANPYANANLSVATGSVRLPGGTVRLIPGGWIVFAYGRQFADVSTGSLVADLQGKTSITAIRYGQNSQRYNITVYITGDLLQENGLHFDAISDPPDLSADDVLNLLGEKNLLESLGSSDQTEAAQRVRDALVGFAIPSVLDPYTSTLARNLGLDYISLEYNSVNLATLGVARSVGPDLTLQYRQQVGTPPPGYRGIYDLQLVYSPRKGPPLFRRLSLSVGTDQDRPYKFALTYGSRFGGYSGPMLRNITVISSPAKP